MIVKQFLSYLQMHIYIKCLRAKDKESAAQYVKFLTEKGQTQILEQLTEQFENWIIGLNRRPWCYDQTYRKNNLLETIQKL
jgi:hypothetical protein